MLSFFVLLLYVLSTNLYFIIFYYTNFLFTNQYFYFLFSPFSHTHTLSLSLHFSTPPFYLLLFNYCFTLLRPQNSYFSVELICPCCLQTSAITRIHFHFVTTNTVLILPLLRIPFRSLSHQTFISSSLSCTVTLVNSVLILHCSFYITLGKAVRTYTRRPPDTISLLCTA